MIDVILFFLSVTLAVFCFQHRRRRLYRLAEKLGGPPGLPIIGNAGIFLRKDFLSALLELDAKCPGIARFWSGHKLVVGINQPELYEAVLSDPAALDKGTFYRFMKPLFGNGLIASDAKIWRFNRKIVAPTLNALKVASSIRVFLEGSKQLAEKWEGKIGEAFEPYDDISKTAFRFTIKTAVGDEIEFSDLQMQEMISSIKRISAGVSYRFLRPWLYPDFFFNLTSTGKQVNSDTAKFRHFLEEMLAGGRTADDNGLFVNHLLAATRKDERFSMSAALDELSTYMTAGFETTSTATTFILIMLGCHPQLQEKVYEELESLSSFADGDQDRNTLSRMKFLERFIKETLRLFPVITIIGREICADIMLGDKIVPKGAIVTVSTYAIHRNPYIWINPEKFDPDRFLPENEKTRHQLCFIPFGAGPRICLGQRYAMTAMKAMVAAIVRKFRIETDYRMEDIKLSKSVTLNTNGLKIRLDKR